MAEEISKISNLNFHIYGGNSWISANPLISDIPGVSGGSPLLSKNYKGHLSRSDVLSIMNRTQINIATFALPLKNYINERFFECLGSDGFLLCGNVGDISPFFEKGVHYDSFESIEEMIEKIHFYINNLDVRRKISSAGFLEVTKNHLPHHRAKQIIDTIQRLT